MRAQEFVAEAKASIRDQILTDVKKSGPGDYFVRFTNADKLGFSARQPFGRTPDADDPDFDVDYIGTGKGRPVIWFYPLKEYLKRKDLYAVDSPYVWLVKLRPDAWLQTVSRGDQGVAPAPPGKQRVGMLRLSTPPAAMFFKPAFDVVGKYYDYVGQHQRHGEVKGAPKPSFFDRVRGMAENMDHSKDTQSVEELKAALLARKDKLQSASDDQVYDIIDKIMTRIAKSHGISGQKLHDMWVDKYKQIPDTWIMNENFADGKKPGRKGLAKRVGVNCKQPVAKLRSIAANSSGERQRMAHWCANMKSGRKK